MGARGMTGQRFRRGDRIDHPAIGRATVVSGRLGAHGEIRVRPDAPHHSGRRVIEVMARRAVIIEEQTK
jgi:hypothetical protein